jgi:hypothetical protein
LGLLGINSVIERSDDVRSKSILVCGLENGVRSEVDGDINDDDGCD